MSSTRVGSACSYFTGQHSTQVLLLAQSSFRHRAPVAVCVFPDFAPECGSFTTCHVHSLQRFTTTGLVLTAGAAGEAVSVVEVPHGLAGLAGSVHALPTLDADTCWETRVRRLEDAS